MGGLPTDADIVDRVLLHARRLSRTRNYDWPTARAALARILEDLENRGLDGASLDRLRQFIADGDRALASRSGAT